MGITLTLVTIQVFLILPSFGCSGFGRFFRSCFTKKSPTNTFHDFYVVRGMKQDPVCYSDREWDTDDEWKHREEQFFEVVPDPRTTNIDVIWASPSLDHRTVFVTSEQNNDSCCFFNLTLCKTRDSRQNWSGHDDSCDATAKLRHPGLDKAKKEKPVHDERCQRVASFWDKTDYQNIANGKNEKYMYFHQFQKKHQTGVWTKKKAETVTNYVCYAMAARKKETVRKKLHGLESHYDTMSYKEKVGYKEESRQNLCGRVLVQSNPDNGKRLEGPPIIAFTCSKRLYISETVLLQIFNVKGVDLLKHGHASVDATDQTLWEVINELGLHKAEPYMSLCNNLRDRALDGIVRSIGIPRTVTDIISQYAGFTDPK